MPYLYAGEAAGPRILRYGVGFTQVGDPYQGEVLTWDARPGGPTGDCVFRTIDVLVRHGSGYSVRVTPVVDGVALPAQDFNGGPPAGALLEEVVQLQADVGMRGVAIAARVETLAVLGETEIVDVQWSGDVVRMSP